MLQDLKHHYEVIIWSSNLADYTKAIIDIIDPQPRKIFSHVLDISNSQKSEDQSINVKPLEVLSTNRKIEHIVTVDSSMQTFMCNLTSGLYIPSYRIENDSTDTILQSLSEYLQQLRGVGDFRQKIKKDFELDELFDSCKQNKAYQKIQDNLTKLQHDPEQHT